MRWRLLGLVLSMMASGACSFLTDAESLSGSPEGGNAEDALVDEAGPVASDARSPNDAIALADAGPVPSPRDAAAPDVALVTDAAQDVADAPPPPPYTLTSSNGTSVINVGDGGACSSSSPTAATLLFRNRSASAYQKQWIHQSCAEVSYTNVMPGADELFDTYEGHRWRLRKTNGEVIVDFTLQTAGDFVVTVY